MPSIAGRVCLPASVIYLRDFRNQFFLDGIPGLGVGLEASLAGLRKMLLELGAQRVLCFGVSVGAFAALSYGLQIRAARVAALCGAVTLERAFNEHLRWTGAAARLTEAYPGLALDMVKEYSHASSAPQVSLVSKANRTGMTGCMPSTWPRPLVHACILCWDSMATTW